MCSVTAKCTIAYSYGVAGIQAISAATRGAGGDCAGAAAVQAISASTRRAGGDRVEVAAIQATGASTRGAGGDRVGVADIQASSASTRRAGGDRVEVAAVQATVEVSDAKAQRTVSNSRQPVGACVCHSCEHDVSGHKYHAGAYHLRRSQATGNSEKRAAAIVAHGGNCELFTRQGCRVVDANVIAHLPLGIKINTGISRRGVYNVDLRGAGRILRLRVAVIDRGFGAEQRLSTS